MGPGLELTWLTVTLIVTFLVEATGKEFILDVGHLMMFDENISIVPYKIRNLLKKYFEIIIDKKVSLDNNWRLDMKSLIFSQQLPATVVEYAIYLLQ